VSVSSPPNLILLLKEMIPSLSAEKDDGKDISTRLFPMEDATSRNQRRSRSAAVHLATRAVQNLYCPERMRLPCIGLPTQCFASSRDDGNICTIDNPLGYDCEAHGCLPLESRAQLSVRR
jgi:hypothetical protein